MICIRWEAEESLLFYINISWWNYWLQEMYTIYLVYVFLRFHFSMNELGNTVSVVKCCLKINWITSYLHLPFVGYPWNVCTWSWVQGHPVCPLLLPRCHLWTSKVWCPRLESLISVQHGRSHDLHECAVQLPGSQCQGKAHTQHWHIGLLNCTYLKIIKHFVPSVMACWYNKNNCIYRDDNPKDLSF